MISTHDRGFLYGDGVFETVRCRNGKLLLWQLHRERLLQSCQTLAIPLQSAEFDQTIAASLAQAPVEDCVFKVIVTRGTGGRGYMPASTVTPAIVVQWHILPEGIEQAFLQGIDCVYCDHPLSLNPVTAGIKHLNRLDQVLASLQLADAAKVTPAIKEGLMCDGEGHVLEGTRTNIFAVIDGQLCTPDLSRAGVAGVMRQYLLERLAAPGAPVQVRQISRDDLRLASELFVCNSVLGVWPVTRIQEYRHSMTNMEVEYTSRLYAERANQAVQEIFGL